MFFKIRVVLVITEFGKTKHQLFGLMCKGGRLLSFTGSLWSSVGILWSFPGSLQSFAGSLCSFVVVCGRCLF